MRRDEVPPGTIVFLWAVPRSRSTVFEHMVRRRGDLRCFHEPFGEVWHCGDDDRCPPAHRYERRPGLTLASRWAELLAASTDRPVFAKDFVHHVEPIADDAFLDRIRHSFLIRDPADALVSLHRRWPDFTDLEAGFEAQRRWFDRVADRTGATPPVVDADDLLADPAGVVEAWCDAVGLPFVADALEWERGSRVEADWYDGAPWHDTLSRSTGFTTAPVDDRASIDDVASLRAAHARAVPHHRHLHAHRLVSSRST